MSTGGEPTTHVSPPDHEPEGPSWYRDQLERLKALTERTGGALVSIAHRPGVAAFHDRYWRFVPQTEGSAARYRIESAALA